MNRERIYRVLDIRHKTFLPTDVVSGYKETKQPPMKDMYDEWLARVICYAFSIEPTPFISQTNRAVANAAQLQSGLDGILPIKNWVKGLIDGILSNQMGMPGLQFQWNEEKPVSPLDQATINKSYVDAGILTVNEVREGLGLVHLSHSPPLHIIWQGGPHRISRYNLARAIPRLCARISPNMQRAIWLHICFADGCV